jgi:hypothetical protein
VDLQCEFVEVLQRNILKFFDEVLLDQQLFHLRSFFFPVRFLQRKEAVANEPSEGNGTVIHGSVPGGSSGQFGNLPLQCLPRLKLRELRFGAENDWNNTALGSVARGVEHGPAKVSVPFLPASHDPSLLVRLAHRFLNFCGERAGYLYFAGVSGVMRRGADVR